MVLGLGVGVRETLNLALLEPAPAAPGQVWAAHAWLTRLQALAHAEHRAQDALGA
jgi:hypothetical protein